MITGTYLFKWTVTAGIYCDPTADTVAITVTLKANAGADQAYCQEISTVNLTGTVGSNGDWTFTSKPSGAADPTITKTSNNTATASGLVLGTYTFRYTIPAEGCDSYDEMTVTLDPPPTAAAAGGDQELCNASAFNMVGNTPAAGIGTWTKIFGPTGETGSFDDPSKPDAIYTPAYNKYGVFVFQWTIAKIGRASCRERV